MKKIIFLAGLPGVGKSTLARKIAARTGGSVLDIDKIKQKVVDPALVTQTIDPPDVRWKCYEKAAREIAGILGQGAPMAVVDEVFHLHVLRERLERLCFDMGCEVIWLEVRCSYKVVEQRLCRNERHGHILSTEEALKMYRLFEPIFEPFPLGKANHFVIRNEDVCETLSLVPNP